MTEDEFLAKLAKVKVKWRFVLGSRLRCTRKNRMGRKLLCCPLSALVNPPMIVEQWRDAAEKLGIDPILAIRIINASDVVTTPSWIAPGSRSNRLRKNLLAACKLKDAA